MAHDHGKWGCACWGADDQIGAANLITPAKRRAALRSIDNAKLYDLAQVTDAGAPFMRPNQPPFLQMMWSTWRDAIARRRRIGITNDAGSNVERVEMTMHVGTHIDALGHVSKGDRLYNDRAAADTLGDWGLAALGIEQAPPMITRGLLLDVASLDGGEYLGPGRVVTPEELAATAAAAGLAIEPGDIVLIRTGWGRHYGTDNARYLEGEPGIDVPAARWLTAQGVVAIGCDNMAVEVLPNPDHTQALPVHQHALAEAGVYLIENLALDDLARDKVTSFCLLILPPKIRGATGAPVRPVAVV
jgi:kynurenine formamidase